MTGAAYAFSAGMLFAALQFNYFFLVEWRLSSAWSSYAVVALSWLAGMLAGLLARPSGGLDAALPPAALAAYYLLLGWTGRHPYDDRLLPACAATVLLSGALSGRFFRRNAGMGVRRLLLHENNGFALGLCLSFLSLALWGSRLLVWAPAVLAANLALCYSFASR